MSVSSEVQTDFLSRMRLSGYSKSEREIVFFLTRMATWRSESESSGAESTSSGVSPSSESSTSASLGSTHLGTAPADHDDASATVSAAGPSHGLATSDLPSAAPDSTCLCDTDSDASSSTQGPTKRTQTLTGLRVFSSNARGAASAPETRKNEKQLPSPHPAPHPVRTARDTRDSRAARAPHPSPPASSRKGSAKKNNDKECKEESYGRTTRDLLLRYFTRRTLATHSLSGKRSPAFRNKPAKPRLDPDIIESIVRQVCEKHNVLPSVVRMAITTKCADETKMMCMRIKQRAGARQGIAS